MVKGAPPSSPATINAVPAVAGRDPSASLRADTGAPLLVPVRGVSVVDLKSTFKEMRGGGRTHEAIDILAPRGTEVLAVADGTIKKLFTSKAGGLTIYQYDDSESTCFYYAHLDRYAEIREGQRLRRGDVIGYVGTSGNAPIGTPHLHFAILTLTPTKEWWKGTPVDPYPLLTTRVSARP